MVKKKPDKLDLRIAEIEAKKVIEIRHIIVQECLDRCKVNHPDCPHLKSTKLCGFVQGALKEGVPEVLEDIGKEN